MDKYLETVHLDRDENEQCGIFSARVHLVLLGSKLK